MPDHSQPTGVSRRKFLGSSGVAAASMVIAGCSENEDGGDDNSSDGSDGSSGSLSGEIDIKGSSTVFPIATAVGEQFENEHSDVTVSVASTGSGGGFENHFCPGNSDINNASRPMKDEEKSLCEENGVEWHEVNVATDALTVIVNNNADFVDCVTVDELAQIWGPDAVSTWSEVRDDWPDEDIERFGAAETSGTFDYFTETINGEEGAHTSDYEPTEQDRTILQGVENSEAAIGYFGFAYYSQNTDRVKALEIDDGGGCTAPTLDNAKSGEYAPLSRPLFTYPSKSAVQEEHVAEFMRFFVEQSANEELIANEVGYVPNPQEDMEAELEELNSFIEEANSS